jgi:hypothetical protein
MTISNRFKKWGKNRVKRISKKYQIVNGELVMGNKPRENILQFTIDNSQLTFSLSIKRGIE